MVQKRPNLNMFVCERFVICWNYGAPAGTRTPILLTSSPYTANYTKCYNSILTNIYSILAYTLTYTKCYWIVLNFSADRNLYGHLKPLSRFLCIICRFLCSADVFKKSYFLNFSTNSFIMFDSICLKKAGFWLFFVWRGFGLFDCTFSLSLAF